MWRMCTTLQQADLSTAAAAHTHLVWVHCIVLTDGAQLAKGLEDVTLDCLYAVVARGEHRPSEGAVHSHTLHPLTFAGLSIQCHSSRKRRTPFVSAVMAVRGEAATGPRKATHGKSRCLCVSLTIVCYCPLPPTTSSITAMVTLQVPRAFSPLDRTCLPVPLLDGWPGLLLAYVTFLARRLLCTLVLGLCLPLLLELGFLGCALFSCPCTFALCLCPRWLRPLALVFARSLVCHAGSPEEEETGNVQSGGRSGTRSEPLYLSRLLDKLPGPLDRKRRQSAWARVVPVVGEQQQRGVLPKFCPASFTWRDGPIHDAWHLGLSPIMHSGVLVL